MESFCTQSVNTILGTNQPLFPFLAEQESDEFLCCSHMYSGHICSCTHTLNNLRGGPLYGHFATWWFHYYWSSLCLLSMRAWCSVICNPLFSFVTVLSISCACYPSCLCLCSFFARNYYTEQQVDIFAWLSGKFPWLTSNKSGIKVGLWRNKGDDRPFMHFCHKWIIYKPTCHFHISKNIIPALNLIRKDASWEAWVVE